MSENKQFLEKVGDYEHQRFGKRTCDLGRYVNNTNEQFEQSEIFDQKYGDSHAVILEISRGELSFVAEYEYSIYEKIRV